MHPLRLVPFRWLVTGQTINGLGNAIAPIALAFAVLDLGGTATELGLVVAAYAAADVIAVLWGGVYGDRLPRRVLMVGANACAALTQAVVAWSLIAGWSSLTLLAVLGAVNGALGALAGPATSAVLPQTVPALSLAKAISWRRLSSNVAYVIGFGLAGVLVAAFGSGGALVIDSATFAIAATCFWFVRVEHEPSAERHSFLAEARAGLSETMRHTWLWTVILMATAYHLFFGGAQGVLGPIVVGEEFGRAAWGYAMSATMVGFVVGGLVTLVWKPRKLLLVGQIMLCLTALFPAAMAAGGHAWVVYLGSALYGFGLEIFSVQWDLAIMQNVPDHLLARVTSVDMIGTFAVRPLGLVLTGPMAAVFGNRGWLWIVAAALLAIELAPLFLRDVRRLERKSHD